MRWELGYFGLTKDFGLICDCVRKAGDIERKAEYRRDFVTKPLSTGEALGETIRQRQPLLNDRRELLEATIQSSSSPIFRLYGDAMRNVL